MKVFQMKMLKKSKLKISTIFPPKKYFLLNKSFSRNKNYPIKFLSIFKVVNPQTGKKIKNFTSKYNFS